MKSTFFLQQSKPLFIFTFTLKIFLWTTESTELWGSSSSRALAQEPAIESATPVEISLFPPSPKSLSSEGLESTPPETEARFLEIHEPVDKDTVNLSLQPAKTPYFFLHSAEFFRNSTSISATPFPVDLLSQQTPPNPNSPESEPDPELGTLLLQELERPTPRQSQPKFYVLGGVDYINSSNIFSLVDPIDDGLINGRLTLLGIPYATQTTAVFASVGGNLARYLKESEFDYNQLTFNVGVRQQLFPRTYGEIGWLNQQLYTNPGGDRFLNDHSLYLELGRQDPLAPQLTLHSAYQLRWSFAEPNDRSQVINALRLSLEYGFAPQWKTALDYQFVLSTFTGQDRQDNYHQVLARLSYNLSKHSRLEAFTGPSFGSSSDSSINIDGYIVGVRFGFNF